VLPSSAQLIVFHLLPKKFDEIVSFNSNYPVLLAALRFMAALFFIASPILKIEKSCH
jgi:hypothetical protein